MLQNSLNELFNDIFLYLCAEKQPRCCKLIRKHSEKLNQNGDLSFPKKEKPWSEFIKSSTDEFTGEENLLLKLKAPDRIVLESKKWRLQLTKFREENDQISMFLERSSAIRVGLLEAKNNMKLIALKLKESTDSVELDPLCNIGCITSLRARCIADTIKNLYVLSPVCSEHCLNVFVTAKSTSYCSRRGSRRVLCGVVLNAKTGHKESVVDTDEIIRKRQAEMTLIAQHKYGVRVSTDSKWKEFIAHLGESAVVFEMLQTRPSSALKIDMECSSTGSSKGASFILYNCARLETMIQTFHEKVAEGIYPPLPEFDKVDFSLLTQEEEWSLVYNYILGFPTMLINCVEINTELCEFRPHFICNFLSSMVKIFSQYYRKTRILTEARSHLLPVMYARLHMIIVLNEILKTCLNILNIKSVSQM